MSTNLFWEAVKPNRATPLSKGLKWAIQKEYGSESTLTAVDIPFLKGVLAAQFKAEDETARDCALLISAIEQHGTIRVWVAG